MGCPYSRSVAAALSRANDGASCSHAISPADIEFSCYGTVANEAAHGPPAFSIEQCRIITETWAKLSPQSTAIGKQVSLCV